MVVQNNVVKCLVTNYK